jgi:hypothetical protein
MEPFQISRISMQATLGMKGVGMYRRRSALGDYSPRPLLIDQIVAAE